MSNSSGGNSVGNIKHYCTRDYLRGKKTSISSTIKTGET